MGASCLTLSADSWALALTSCAASVALSFSCSPTSWAADFAWSMIGCPCSWAASLRRCAPWASALLAGIRPAITSPAPKATRPAARGLPSTRSSMALPALEVALLTPWVAP